MRKVLLSLALLLPGQTLLAVETMSCPQSLFEDRTLKVGCVWYRSSQKTEIKTLHGTLQAQPADFFVEYRENKVFVFNHAGKLKVKLRDGRDLIVPAGFQVWISEIGSDRKNGMGLISAIDLKEHISRLFPLWSGDVSSFRQSFSKVHEKWGPSTDIAARYYKGLVQRKIASIEKEKARVRSAQARELEIRRQNQRILFERTFNR